ncbi:MAG TPA: hypothetical protein VGH02_11845 [Rhizomicrobium sp.]|jgi:lipoprotein NlpI
MRKSLELVFALCLLGGKAEASGYTELNAGLAAGADARCDLAVAHLTAALAAPNLLPAFQAAAHYGLGACHFNEGKLTLAAADFDATVASDPMYRDAYISRADLHDLNHEFSEAAADRTAILAFAPQMSVVLYDRARDCELLGRMDDAIADASRVKTLSPSDPFDFMLLNEIYRMKGDTAKAIVNANALVENKNYFLLGYRERGFDNFGAGDFARAQSDFDDWKIRERGTLYPALWSALAAAAQGSDPASAVGGLPANFDVNTWPVPLLKFYQGRISSEDVTKAMVPDGILRRYQQCEVDFFIGDLEVHRGDMSGKAKLENAAKECHTTSTELRAAILELKRLP